MIKPTKQYVFQGNDFYYRVVVNTDTIHIEVGDDLYTWDRVPIEKECIAALVDALIDIQNSE